MTQEEFFKRYSYDVLEDRIGGGGFGTVYKAYDNVWHHDVAIKVSEVKKTANGKVFSLKDEVEALSGLPDHPNIANYEKDKLFTFKTPQGVFDYAVMQYYPDGNLSNAIKQGLTAEQKEDIATQLLEGIDFLHKHKVVHRDLKPGNILIVKHSGRIIPLITDFGLSKAAGVVDGSVFSNSFGAGTPRYSSPEQLQGNDLRFNTDLWSYGAILYELFTGEQLFSAGSGAANTAQADMEIFNKIVNGNVNSLGKMPEKWRKVAERCLVVDATKRAKDAEELFSIIKGDEDETVTDMGHGTAGHETPAGRTPTDKPKKALWIGIAIVAAAVVALLVLLLKPKQEPTSTDLDTQAYEACQTVADYRAYMSDYGRNALHYDDAKAFIDHYMADSIQQVQDSLTRLHDYVDLGLPSGTLWATCNVGASKPEDYGSYFAWGETSTKEIYRWTTYKYTEGADYKLTKYCSKPNYGNNGFTDNLTTLQASDDPATANWGSGWRTPSKAQWEEILNNTTRKWTTQNGKKGYLFTSKKNGRSVFLPAAGYRCDSEPSHAGSDGNYWSRSLYVGYPYNARGFSFNSGGCDMDSGNRNYGLSVRPVSENSPCFVTGGKTIQRLNI